MVARQSDIWNLDKGITQSMLSKFLSCKERFRLSYVEGMIPEREGSKALLFGTTWHELSDMLYTLAKNEGADSFMSNLALNVKLSSEVYKEFALAQTSFSGYTEEQVKEAVGIASAMLPHYFEHYEDDIRNMEWVSLEEVFAVKIPLPSGRELVLKGKFDGIVRIKGKLWLFETKTKSKVDEDVIADKLPIDLQVNVYLLAIWLTYGEPPAGVIYNVVQKPTFKQGKNQSLSDYFNRVNLEVYEEPVKYFTRTFGSVHHSEIEKWRTDQLIPILEDLESWAETSTAHYRNVQSCTNGWYPCEYLPLCGQGSSGHLTKRKGLFSELTSIPLKELLPTLDKS